MNLSKMKVGQVVTAKPQELIKVEVVITKQFEEGFLKIMNNLKMLGLMGCSREIKLDTDCNGVTTMGYMDGDGADHIESVKVIGE